MHANKSTQNNTHHIAINIYLYSINHLSTKGIKVFKKKRSLFDIIPLIFIGFEDQNRICHLVHKQSKLTNSC